MKLNVNVSINEGNIKEARRKRINISQAAEIGMRKELEMNALKDSAIYPKELAKTDPEQYWINPKGDCMKRGEPQYFISEHGAVHEVSKELYMKWLKYYVKNPKEIFPPKTKEQKINKGIRESFADA